mgnify:CR=1 FL=1
MEKQILNDLSIMPRNYSYNSSYAEYLEQMFLDGFVEFRGDDVFITDLGLRHLKEIS